MSDSSKKGKSRESGRGSLLLIIVSVYLAFFATAVISIYAFFGQNLPAGMGLENISLPRFLERPEVERRPTEQPRAEQEQEPADGVNGIGGIGGALARVGAWMEGIDLSGAFDAIGGAVRAAGRWIAGAARWVGDGVASLFGGGPAAQDREQDGERRPEVSGPEVAEPAVRVEERRQEPPAEEREPEVVAAADELADLRERLAEGLEEIAVVTDLLIQMVEEQDIPEEEKRRRIARLEERARETADEYAEPAERRAVRPSQPDTREAERLAENYRGQLRAAEQEHQRQMAELRQKMTRLEQDLVARYNPRFTTPELQRILSRARERQTPVETASFDPLLERQDILTRERYQEITAALHEIERLTDRLLQVPYRNSVPEALIGIRDSSRELAAGYDELWTNLAERLTLAQTENDRLQLTLNETRAEAEMAREQLRKRGLLVARFLDNMDNLTLDTRETGYVLDSQDPESILLHVGAVYGADVGDLVYVFREDDQLIATLRITAADDPVRARLVQLRSQERPILPFDKVLVELRAEVGG